PVRPWPKERAAASGFCPPLASASLSTGEKPRPPQCPSPDGSNPGAPGPSPNTAMRVLTLTDCRHGVRHRQGTAFLRGQDITWLRRNHHCRWVEVTWIASVDRK